MLRRLLIVALLCTAPFAVADSNTDLAWAKTAFSNVKSNVDPGVINRLEHDRRFAIWSAYYDMLEQLTRLEVHHDMMRRHRQNRQAEFDAAFAEFTKSVETLRHLLHGVE